MPSKHLTAALQTVRSALSTALDAQPDARASTFSLPVVTAAAGERQSSATLHLRRAIAAAGGRLEVQTEAEVSALDSPSACLLTRV